MARNSMEQLRQKIKMLEKKQAFELQGLHQALKNAYENLRIKDLVKTGVSEVIDKTEIKDKVVNNTVGATAGFLAKRILLGSNLGPVKGLLGLALQLGVSSVVSNNMDNIKAFGKKLINRSSDEEIEKEEPSAKKERPKKRKS